MDHDSRMALSRQVTEHLLRNHPDIVAIAIQGSTAKGEDREHSDLEMIAITEGKSDTQHYQTIYGGIVVEVVFYSREEAEKEAASVGFDWPVVADGWVNALATYDPENLLPRLAGLAANPDPEKVIQGRRGAITALYEGLCKMRNFALDQEDDMVRLMSPFLAVDAAKFLSLLNSQHYNGMRNLLTKPRDFAVLPNHFWEDYPTLLTANAQPKDLMERAERLYEECRELWTATRPAYPEEGGTLEEALVHGRVLRNP
jgi:predicted nucleotidyltransferase